mmetsp:Transcript_41172/g.84649  ORF Transcript_41172/g.84649 Transcript_41172/m.84649 type:complete len:259 (-) Transcript_41172:57-833(-)
MQPTATLPVVQNPYVQPLGTGTFSPSYGYGAVPAPILPQPAGYMYSYDPSPHAGAASYAPAALPATSSFSYMPAVPAAGSFSYVPAAVPATSSFSYAPAVAGTSSFSVSQPVRSTSFETYPASIPPMAAGASLSGSFVAPAGPATGSYVPPPLVDAATGSFVPPVATSGSFTYPGLPTVGSFVSSPAPGPIGLAKLSASRPFKFYVEPPEKRKNGAEGSKPSANPSADASRPPVHGSTSSAHKVSKKGKKKSSMLGCC